MKTYNLTTQEIFIIRDALREYLYEIEDSKARDEIEDLFWKFKHYAMTIIKEN